MKEACCLIIEDDGVVGVDGLVVLTLVLILGGCVGAVDVEGDIEVADVEVVDMVDVVDSEVPVDTIVGVDADAGEEERVVADG